jgi:hypothetical protein
MRSRAVKGPPDKAGAEEAAEAEAGAGAEAEGNGSVGNQPFKRSSMALCMMVPWLGLLSLPRLLEVGCADLMAW